MEKVVFLSRRKAPLPSWLKAFPNARVTHYFSPTEIPDKLGDALVWLHIDVQTRNPAMFVEQIKRGNPGTPVVVLSNVAYDEEGLTMLEAGASGYCSALAAPNVLRQIASVIDNGGVWVGAELMGRLIQGLGRKGVRPQADSQLEKLSPREREVALAVGKGSANKEVAQQLGITERTVKAHLASIFETLKVRDRLQLAILLSGLPNRDTVSEAESNQAS